MKKVFSYIRNHFLIRNLLLLVCSILVFTFIVNVLLSLFTRHGQRYDVPDFVGLSYDQAVKRGKDADLKFEILDSLYMPKEEPGVVLDQNPKPGAGVKSGRKIFLVVNAFRPKMDVIPYVTGFSLRQAKNMLESKGFEIEKLIYRNDIATNNVLQESYRDQTISQGSQIKAELGSGITLTVGVNIESPLPLVTNVCGMTLREAKSRLWEAGLNIGNVKLDAGENPKDDNNLLVYKQLPPSHTRADYGQRVNLYLSSDRNKVTQAIKEKNEALHQELTQPESDEPSEEEILRALMSDE